MDLDEAYSISDEHDPLESAVNLEEQFYTQGYKAGHAHGQLHGLFEGRQLGREKAFELWEEVGFYEGWAGFWVERYSGAASVGKGRSKESRVLGHAKQLSDLISTFPTHNPTPELRTTSTSTDSADEKMISDSQPEVDLTALLSQIRAKYRLLCASLGARPRLVAASGGAGGGGDSEGGVDAGGGGNVVEGIEGPMKGVDTSRLKY